MWIYNGTWPPPKPNAFKCETDAEHIYVLEFSTRTKVGVSRTVADRLTTLVWEHEKLAGEKPQRVAVTLQTPWARQIEKQVLANIVATRLHGEYTTESFDRVAGLVIENWLARTEQATATQIVIGGRLPEQPRLYKIRNPAPMWLVQWTEPKRPGHTGRRKRTRKCFVQESDARDYLAVAINLWRSRLLNQQQDAMQALALLEDTGISLTELARNYMKARR